MQSNCRFPNEDRPFFICHPWLTALLLIFGLGLFALAAYSVLTRSLLFAYDKPLSTLISADVKTLPPGYLTPTPLGVAPVRTRLPVLVNPTRWPVLPVQQFPTATPTYVPIPIE